jgi:hypothetical protein
VGIVSPLRLPDDPDRLNARKDAQTTLAAYRAFLADPAFTHRVDLKVLTAIAGDAKMPTRERRRAAEMLGTLYMRALEKVADLSAAREQVLLSIGIDPSRGSTTVAVDARQVTIEADRDALRRLLADPEASDLAAALARRVDGRSRDDGAPPVEGTLPAAAAPDAPLASGGGGGQDGRAAPRPDAAAAREE